MKAIMYHYIRKRSSKFPNFRFLDFDNFKRQLDFFDNNYGFVTRDEWLDFIECGALPKTKGKLVLTFDDAMSDHFEYVFPELKLRNLWGIFYVPTAPYTKRVLLDVHKIHLLCGAFSGSDLLEHSSRVISEDMIPYAKRDEFRTKTYTRQHNHEGVTEFKRIFNYFIDPQYRAGLLDDIAEKFGILFNPEDFYVSEGNIKEMAEYGMIIGSHTVNHPVMNKLNFDEQKAEISDSFDYISSVISPKYLTYCHPYGGFHSFNDDTVDILNAFDVKFSFNVDARDIESSDILTLRQCLPRYDCNLFDHGKAS